MGSPLGGSTFVTVAPRSDRMPPAAGTNAHMATSTTLMPSSGLGMSPRAPRRFYIEDSLSIYGTKRQLEGNEDAHTGRRTTSGRERRRMADGTGAGAHGDKPPRHVETGAGAY